jgi:hypothetical protein
MKHVFFFVGGWEFLLSMAWRQGRLQNGDASVLVALKLWCRWYVCVIVGRMTMVWQGSCWGSQKVAAEGFVEEKINNVGFFCFGRRGKLWE